MDPWPTRSVIGEPEPTSTTPDTVPAERHGSEQETNSHASIRDGFVDYSLSEEKSDRWTRTCARRPRSELALVSEHRFVLSSAQLERPSFELVLGLRRSVEKRDPASTSGSGHRSNPRSARSTRPGCVARSTVSGPPDSRWQHRSAGLAVATRRCRARGENTPVPRGRDPAAPASTVETSANGKGEHPDDRTT